MTLKEYIQGLQEFVEENPEAADFKVVSAIDEEGNGFNEVKFGPTLGYFDDSYGGFTHADEEELEEEPNAVCIN